MSGNVKDKDLANSLYILTLVAFLMRVSRPPHRTLAHGPVQGGLTFSLLTAGVWTARIFAVMILT